MQILSTRAVRLGAMTLGSVALMGVGANAADASTSVRYGTSGTSNPTSTSSLVTSGQGVGTGSGNGVLSSSYTAPPQNSGSTTPTTGSCSVGNVNGVLNGSNPSSTSVGFNTATLNLNTCTTNVSPGPVVYTLRTISLTSPSTFTVQSGGTSPQSGTLTVTNPTFGVVVRLSSGLDVTCSVGLVSGTSVTGVLRNSDPNSSNRPTLEFNNVTVKSLTNSGTCNGAVGDGSTTLKRSVFNVKFGQLVVTSGTGLGNRVGVFS